MFYLQDEITVQPIIRNLFIFINEQSPFPALSLPTIQDVPIEIGSINLDEG